MKQKRTARKLLCTKVCGYLSQSKPIKPKQKRATAKPSEATPKACVKNLIGRKNLKFDLKEKNPKLEQAKWGIARLLTENLSAYREHTRKETACTIFVQKDTTNEKKQR